jgi:hypothetical protein
MQYTRRGRGFKENTSTLQEFLFGTRTFRAAETWAQTTPDHPRKLQDSSNLEDKSDACQDNSQNNPQKNAWKNRAACRHPARFIAHGETERRARPQNNTHVAAGVRCETEDWTLPQLMTHRPPPRGRARAAAQEKRLSEAHLGACRMVWALSTARSVSTCTGRSRPGQ